MRADYSGGPGKYYDMTMVFLIGVITVGVRKYVESISLGLRVIKILTKLLHLFALRLPIVVFVDHPLAHVRSITDNPLWYITMKTMSDATSTNRVRTHTRRPDRDGSRSVMTTKSS